MRKLISVFILIESQGIVKPYPKRKDPLVGSFLRNLIFQRDSNADDFAIASHAHGRSPGSHPGGNDLLGRLRVGAIVTVILGKEGIGNEIDGEYLTAMGMAGQNQIHLRAVFRHVGRLMIQNKGRQGAWVKIR